MDGKQDTQQDTPCTHNQRRAQTFSGLLQTNGMRASGSVAIAHSSITIWRALTALIRPGEEEAVQVQIMTSCRLNSCSRAFLRRSSYLKGNAIHKVTLQYNPQVINRTVESYLLIHFGIGQFLCTFYSLVELFNFSWKGVVVLSHEVVQGDAPVGQTTLD